MAPEEDRSLDSWLDSLLDSGSPKGSESKPVVAETTLPILKESTPKKIGRGHRRHPIGITPKYWTVARIKALSEELLEWIKKPDSLLLMDFFVERLVNDHLARGWLEEHTFFHDAYETALNWQRSLLLKKGLNRQHDARFSEFALRNLYPKDMNKDKAEQAKVTAVENDKYINRQTLVLFNNGLKSMGSPPIEVKSEDVTESDDIPG